MINIFTLKTNKLVEKLREGEISSVEVCTQYIDRIKKFENNVTQNLFINLPFSNTYVGDKAIPFNFTNLYICSK